MNKIRAMLVMITSAATVAVADPQVTATPTATPPVPTPPPNPALHAVPGQPTAGPRPGAPANSMTRRFMGGANEGMIMWMLSGDPRAAQELGLSDAQVKEFKDAMASSDQEMAELNGKLEQAAKLQSELWTAEPLDEEAIMKAMAVADDLRSQVGKMRVKQALNALKALTPEQRAKLRETIKQRMEQRTPWTQPGMPRNPQPGANQGRGLPQGVQMNLQPAIPPAIPPAIAPPAPSAQATLAPAPATPPVPAVVRPAAQ